MKLSIVIPAYNEEEAIVSIIDRTLAARPHIFENSPVDDVEVIVVSDGSTDRTAELAGGYDAVRLIVFHRNRGYGAAIKRGFEEGAGELIGFLDADGTCDPNFFAPLCTAVVEENASVAIGSRMSADSCMPALRRFGNRGYALILSLLSNRLVTDAASGMRVLRRDVLPHLYPLPDGLHFTPAMSARVLMDDRLTIVECPMPYRARIGESKLHVIGDGLRFLRTIFEMTLMWRPGRLFMLAAVFCFVLLVLLAMHPIEMWLTLGRLQESMIYRLLFCSLLGTMGATLLSSAVICDLLAGLLDGQTRSRTFLARVLDHLYTFSGVGIVAVPMLPLLAWLVGGGVSTFVTAGFVDLHWSRVVLAGLIVFGIGQMLVTVLIANILRFHAARRKVRSAARASDQVSVPAQTLGRSRPVSRPAEAEVVA